MCQNLDVQKNRLVILNPNRKKRVHRGSEDNRINSGDVLNIGSVRQNTPNEGQNEGSTFVQRDELKNQRLADT